MFHSCYECASDLFDLASWYLPFSFWSACLLWVKGGGLAFSPFFSFMGPRMMYILIPRDVYEDDAHINLTPLRFCASEENS